MQPDYEELRAELGEMYALSRHMTEAEKLELAAFLRDYPEAVFSSFGGLEVGYMRDIIIKRMGGTPLSRFDCEEMVSLFVCGDLEGFLLGKVKVIDFDTNVICSPQGKKGTR